MYYSHSKKDEFDKVFGSKELKTHIRGVLEKSLFHLSTDLDLGYSNEELKELLQIIVEFHDLGKYTSFFQNYLLGKEPLDLLLKRHAQIGGFAAYNLLKEIDEKKALLALYIIFLHHSQLIDLLQIRNKLGNNLMRIIGKQQEDLRKAINIIEEDLSRKRLVGIINYSEESKINKGFKHWAKLNPSIQDYFLINYLFSLLIEADKLDASDTKPYSLKSINPSSVDERFGNPNSENPNLRSMTNDELRNYCRKVVVSHLENDSILDQYIFTLTAPTGIGKTMTALDFALKLKSKIKQKQNIEPRIIYALPFINIIEQALNEYKSTLPEDIHILGHYQYADIFGEEKNFQNDDGAEINYNQKLMALDTWQADIVITSFVQFFETLIGNRNKLLKKFNHFANSIIILDEVQTLRLDQMPLLGAVLFYLSKFLKSRIVLMTATRPKIFELAEQEILKNEKQQVNPKELLTTYEAVFSLFKRTSIYPLLDVLTTEKEKRVEEFVELIFSEKWAKEKSCLIVCNTVNLSIELHQGIAAFLEKNECKNPLYYLSTNIVPTHRFSRIEDVKEDIRQKNAPILIATQVVEAGVDLDFDMGFRDVGPIDSIIQVAGRINRNNDKTRNFSPLYIMDFNEKTTKMVYGRLSYDQAIKSLSSQPSFTEPEYLKLINEYFDGISGKSSFAKSRNFFASMKTLKYDSDDAKNDCAVSAFRIIEQTDRYSPVFVEIDGEATKAKNNYLHKIKNEISKEEFDKKWKLKFEQRIISVPKYLCDELKNINEFEENILLVPKEEIKGTYSLSTGFERNQEKTNTAFIL
ncbi:MAG TPA: CRISPR-associated helicase Cas3' [Flavobacteriaceae bacterium]|nr:CRISPR-associated helicase Cas3' [Flavobacteriaceae bacterium]